jgi:ABC-type Fe3+/spermidine/putrescine transport system ATPase subunit
VRFLVNQNATPTSVLAIDELCVAYRTRTGVIPAVTKVSLHVQAGECVGLVGESGCGKSTVALAIMQYLGPSGSIQQGSMRFQGRDLRRLRRRELQSLRGAQIAMVYQDPMAALHPSLTIGAQLLEVPCTHAHLRRHEAMAAVRQMLTAVQLSDVDRLLAAYPHQLSGGQQQRVAMARAVVYRPDVLLLDEPLSNLDVKLRVAMRAELKRLQQALGITTLFVTHDQHEALALSDRIAVMREGRIEQLGTPEEIYQHPRSLFVADFVGSTNLLDGVVHAVDTEAGTVVVRIGDRLVTAKTTHRMTAGSAIRVAVKPERVALSSRAGQRAGDTGGLPGEIESVAYLGSFYSYIVAIGSQRIEARSAEPIVDDGTPAGAGAIVEVRFSPESTRVFAA